MYTVNELVALLEETRPPKPLLVYHPKFHAPKYIVDSVTELTGKFHPPPFSAEEWKAIQAAKVAADKNEEQTRADEVFPNLLIGNQVVFGWCSFFKPADWQLDGFQLVFFKYFQTCRLATRWQQRTRNIWQIRG